MQNAMLKIMILFHYKTLFLELKQRVLDENIYIKNRSNSALSLLIFMSGRHLQNLILSVSLQKERIPVNVKKFSNYFKNEKS